MPGFKAQVAIAALKGDNKTLAALAQQLDVARLVQARWPSRGPQGCRRMMKTMGIEAL